MDSGDDGAISVLRSVDQTPPEVFRIDFEEARRVHEDLHDRAMSICRGAGESPSKIVERDIAEARGIDQGADDGRVPSFRRAVEKLPEIGGIDGLHQEVDDRDFSFCGGEGEGLSQIERIERSEFRGEDDRLGDPLIGIVFNREDQSLSKILRIDEKLVIDQGDGEISVPSADSVHQGITLDLGDPCGVEGGPGDAWRGGEGGDPCEVEGNSSDACQGREGRDLRWFYELFWRRRHRRRRRLGIERRGSFHTASIEKPAKLSSFIKETDI